ncbi:MAG TPA: AAA family ATPase, partial [Ktedonobacteraceae bacterium]
MPKAAPYTLRWLPARNEYACLDGCEQVGIVKPSDHSQLLHWLHSVDAFAFRGCAGAYTVRRERIRTGNRYWYAYRRVGGRVQKHYLGKSEALTLERLEQVAMHFAAESQGGHKDVPLRWHGEALEADSSVVGETTRVVRPRGLPGPLPNYFKVPLPPHHVIPRIHLMDELRAALSKPLTLISASAGSGKSTLLSCWLSQLQADVSLRIGWISLESDDAEPTRFWNLLFTVFHALCPDSGVDVLALRYARQQEELERKTPLVGAFLAQLLEQLRISQQEMLLVLDDYHHVEDATIAQGMTWVLEHLPRNVHLVISTRVDPQLPLARLRVRDQIVELRDTDLRFTSREAATFLTRRAMLNVSQEEIDFLYERTEGWIAGLQLAAILLQRRNERTNLFHAFSGGHRYIDDYLVQEVLEHLPASIQHFLLCTSILERLQGK